MNFVAELFAFILVFGATYFLFAALGLRSDSLFYSKNDKLAFDRLIQGQLGQLATITSIFGTLTSLATVYVFFIGTSRLFGVFIFTALLSLIVGAYVTNYVTRKVLAQSYVRELYSNTDQISAVFASLFWSPDPRGRLQSKLIKLITLANITCVLWLEFAVLADLTGLLGISGDILSRSVVFFVAAMIVVLFVLRFGLRGFVFADLLQSPIIAITSVLVLAGIAGAILYSRPVDWLSLARPAEPSMTIVAFILHVFIVNGFFVLVTEGHWMRIWLYRERETTFQVTAILSTSFAWTILIVVGLIGGVVTSQSGDAAVADILQYAQKFTPAVIVAFWIAAVAILFATVDASIYGLLLVLSFNPETGQLDRTLQRPQRILLLSLGAAVGGAVTYFLVRYAEIPLEKLVFILIPICLNALPALLFLALGRSLNPKFTQISLIGYCLVAALALFQPEGQLFVALSAAVVPLTVAVIALAFDRSRQAVPQVKISTEG